MGLAAALFLSSAGIAGATEIPEETVLIPETTAAAEETTPPETTAAAEVTEPPETTEAAEVPETTAPSSPAEEPTIPETTEETQIPAIREGVTKFAQRTTFAADTVPSVSTVSISEANAMSAGTQDITIQGIVVYLSDMQAVLQDDTGGIRLSFSETPEAEVGDVLLVTGTRSGGIRVTDYEIVGREALPAVETTLREAPVNVRVRIQNATLGEGTISQNGFSLTLVATLPGSAAQAGAVDAYGVTMDGRFYADAILPRTSEEEDAGSGEPVWNIYFGQLHAHTSLSDGLGTVEQAFQYAAEVGGLDFFAVTDHSDSFDNAADGAIGTDGTDISEEWKEGKAAAAAVTDDTFVGIFGYEMSWPDNSTLGHISTFNTPGWQAWGQPGFETLQSYYEALTTVPGSVSQFNHPGYDLGTFQNFSNYTAAYDEQIQLLEVGSEDGETNYGAYTQALDLGWHLAPSNNQNNHEGGWGDASSVRTAVLAEELTEESLYEAIRSYRVYATEDSDLSIRYTLNGKTMGSILGPTDSVEIRVSLEDPMDTAIGTVEVIVDGGEVVAARTVTEASAELTITVSADYSYYYLRITQPDGDIAVTAPVWIDSYEDMGIRSFTSDVEDPLSEQEVNLTLQLFNDEKAEFVLEKLEFTKNGAVIHQDDDPGSVDALSSYSCSFPFTSQSPGEVQITATVTGKVAEQTRTYTETLTLRFQPKQAEIAEVTIAEARAAASGTVCRVTGYITAGNVNRYNTFPNTLYLQDDSGGIAVVGTAASGIEVGTAMEVTGVLREEKGNLVLEMTAYTLTGQTAYRYVPRTMTNAVAMNYAAHGGELLQVEGEVVSLTKTADGKGISRFTIRDIRGDLATVLIEDGIFSGADGLNELASEVKKGRTVRAMGLLHVDEFGETVLRVRNCDEVAYVPPKKDPTNPKTGDWLLVTK